MRRFLHVHLCADAGGMMSLGGIPQLNSIQYTPIIQQSYYVVNVTDTLVNGVSVGVPASTYATWQSIVDSGTTGSIPVLDACAAFMYDFLCIEAC